MQTRDADILVIPGWKNSDRDHWQSRWERNLSTARRVAQDDWDTPRCADWARAICAAGASASRPIVLLAHGCGVLAAAHALIAADGPRVAGAFLVAPPDLSASDDWPARKGGFWPPPLAPLPTRVVLVASRSDRTCRFDEAEAMAQAWNAQLVDAGPSGHINTASGQGPWPDGLLQFGRFLKSI